jgi:hypothetical protein
MQKNSRKYCTKAKRNLSPHYEDEEVYKKDTDLFPCLYKV